MTDDGGVWVKIDGGGEPDAGGLVHINTTTFSAVSSVSIDNVFTSTYDNYRLVMSLAGSSAASNGAYIRLRSSSSDAVTNYLATILYINSSYVSADMTTQFNLGAIGNWTAVISLDISSPFLTAPTNINGLCGGITSDYHTGFFGGQHTASTSYDGFTAFTDAVGSNVITGTIRVYGYRNGA